MYVLETKCSQYGISPTVYLHEMTKAEFEQAVLSTNISKFKHKFERVTAQYARAYVKSGGIHTTALWVNPEGQVRKAEEGY